MVYTPQYVSFGEIPIHVPDDYTSSQKADALQYAESSIELDVNDGEHISEKKQISAVDSAVKQLATAHLVRSSEETTDVKLGDLEDSGSVASDLADDFESSYDEQVSRIINSGVFDDNIGGESNAPYITSTHREH